MNHQKYLKEYTDSIKRLKKECISKGISENEFRKLYLESLKSIEKTDVENTANVQYFRTKRKLVLSVILLILIVFALIYIYFNVLCNIQELIYPGLRLIRKISIPFISLFPALTG